MRRRYQVALMSLGWLLALVLALELGLAAALRAGHGRVDGWLTEMAAWVAHREGRAWERARGKSRRDELAPMREILDSPPRLRKPERVLAGAFEGNLPASFAGLARLEEELGYQFPLVSIYTAWGDRPDQQFPRRAVDTIHALGSVPVVTWEPWVVDFDASLRPNLPAGPAREYATLAAIARGDYDFYVVPWARAAAAFGKPMFLRLAHEMNDPYRYPWGPQNGNRPEDFIAAWRHVHDVFAKMGATNVLWVWSPHASMPWFEYYFPGRDVVDWIGVGVLNYGTTAPWSRWWSAEQILANAYPVLVRLDKPIMVAELGTVASGGDPAAWYDAAFRSFRERHPAVRSLVFFQQERDVTLSAQPLDWSVYRAPAVRDAVAGGLRALDTGRPATTDGGPRAPSPRRRKGSTLMTESFATLPLRDHGLNKRW